MDDISDYMVLIDDDRYGALDLRFILARGEACAARIADRILAESSHHRGVEVWTLDAMIYASGSTQRASETAQPSSA